MPNVVVRLAASRISGWEVVIELTTDHLTFAVQTCLKHLTHLHSHKEQANPDPAVLFDWTNGVGCPIEVPHGQVSWKLAICFFFFQERIGKYVRFVVIAAGTMMCCGMKQTNNIPPVI